MCDEMRNKVLRLLKENSVMHLATCSDNKPRSSIMEYGIVDGSLIFATFPETIKSMNLAHNPRVSLTVGGTPTYATVDGTVTDPDLHEIEGFNKILFERHLLGIRHQIYADRYTNPYNKYSEFRDMLMSGNMNLIYYKIIFDTAHYTHGTGAAELVDMKRK
jgi:uncharacterized pyridoxamine 5'-phosphate oxidase family protein